MSDIVERLRGLPLLENGALCAEAAAEIERLRAQVADARQHAVEARLREKAAEDARVSAVGRAAAAEVNVAALREVLETYACDCLIGECVDGFQSCGSRASDALEDKG